MADADVPRSVLSETIEERGRINTKMRQLMPQVGAGPVDRRALTNHQRNVLDDYERPDGLVRRLRAQAGHHDHP